MKGSALVCRKSLHQAFEGKKSYSKQDLDRCHVIFGLRSNSDILEYTQQAAMFLRGWKRRIQKLMIMEQERHGENHWDYLCRLFVPHLDGHASTSQGPLIGRITDGAEQAAISGSYGFTRSKRFRKMDAVLASDTAL